MRRKNSTRARLRNFFERRKTRTSNFNQEKHEFPFYIERYQAVKKLRTLFEFEKIGQKPVFCCHTNQSEVVKVAFFFSILLSVSIRSAFYFLFSTLFLVINLTLGYFLVITENYFGVTNSLNTKKRSHCTLRSFIGNQIISAVLSLLKLFP